MDIDKREKNDTIIVDIKENVTMENVNDFGKKMEDLIPKEENIMVILNFEGVDYLCSSGFGVVAEVLKRVRSTFGDVFFVNLSERTQRLFDVTRLTKIVKVFDSEEEALVHLGKS